MKERTKELIRIIKEDYGRELSKEEAEELGSSLLGLAKILVEKKK